MSQYIIRHTLPPVVVVQLRFHFEQNLYHITLIEQSYCCNEIWCTVYLDIRNLTEFCKFLMNFCFVNELRTYI